MNPPAPQITILPELISLNVVDFRSAQHSDGKDLRKPIIGSLAVCLSPWDASRHCPRSVRQPEFIPVVIVAGFGLRTEVALAKPKLARYLKVVAVPAVPEFGRIGK